MNAGRVREAAGRDGPDPIDIHVGKRLSIRRRLVGLSQQRLANALGITFQQVQKYEKASNRISAGRLYRVAQILDVPVSFFFDELSSKNAPSRDPLGLKSDGLDSSRLIASRREALELIKAYYAIPDKRARKQLYDLVKMVAGAMQRPQAEEESAAESEES